MHKKKPRVYKVSVSKEFTYPEFTIDETNTLADLHYKATSEFLEQVKNSNYNPEDLNFVIEAVEPYVFDKKVPKNANVSLVDTGRRRLTANFLINEICLKIAQDKFGEFCIETNPNLFESEEIKSPWGNRIQYTLKKDIKEFISEQFNTFYKIFTKHSI